MTASPDDGTRASQDIGQRRDPETPAPRQSAVDRLIAETRSKWADLSSDQRLRMKQVSVLSGIALLGAGI